MRPRLGFTVCALVAALALPATPALAARGKTARFPTITGISPAKLAIGEVLTIRGSGFTLGQKRNTVVFKRDGKRAIFAKADEATATQIKVTVSTKLLPFLDQKDGAPVATRFRVRVLAKRFGRSFTTLRLSPMIGPAGTTEQPGAPPPTAIPDCDNDRIPNDQEFDDDNDLIPDARETEIHTDPCKPDTDNDGMEDGWEYESALDYNSRALPYPGKRPYTNPLDGGDANADHDNDALNASEEYAMWVRYGNHALPLNYSDGDQTTGDPFPAPVGYEWMDYNAPAGVMSDDEKDVDGDGLGNWDELHGPFNPGKSKDKDKYPLDYLDPDTDGDGVLDGADDQDHDGYSNSAEVQRSDRRNYNPQLDPCDPDPASPYCGHYTET